MVNEQGHYIPQCKADGSYKQVQCNSVTEECWCVDKKGLEKPETKTTGQPHCDYEGTCILAKI